MKEGVKLPSLRVRNSQLAPMDIHKSFDQDKGKSKARLSVSELKAPLMREHKKRSALPREHYTEGDYPANPSYDNASSMAYRKSTAPGS